MAWMDLEWPDLSPAFSEPRVTRPAPERPDVPARIGEQVRAAERRRAIGVQLCVLGGVALSCAAFAVYAAGAHPLVRASGRNGAVVAALALLATGLLVAFPLAALLALRLGPTWEQRQQHWRYLRWRQEYDRWLATQRRVYLSALPPAQRMEFSRLLRERRP